MLFTVPREGRANGEGLALLGKGVALRGSGGDASCQPGLVLAGSHPKGAEKMRRLRNAFLLAAILVALTACPPPPPAVVWVKVPLPPPEVEFVHTAPCNLEFVWVRGYHRCRTGPGSFGCRVPGQQPPRPARRLEARPLETRSARAGTGLRAGGQGSRTGSDHVEQTVFYWPSLKRLYGGGCRLPAAPPAGKGLGADAYRYLGGGALAVDPVQSSRRTSTRDVAARDSPSAGAALRPGASPCEPSPRPPRAPWHRRADAFVRRACPRRASSEPSSRSGSPTGKRGVRAARRARAELGVRTGGSRPPLSAAYAGRALVCALAGRARPGRRARQGPTCGVAAATVRPRGRGDRGQLVARGEKARRSADGGRAPRPCPSPQRSQASAVARSRPSRSAAGPRRRTRTKGTTLFASAFASQSAVAATMNAFLSICVASICQTSSAEE